MTAFAQPDTPSTAGNTTAGNTHAAITIEAEDFVPQTQNGWKVVKNGEGNMMVDIIGFSHISGEHLLHASATTQNATAIRKVVIPHGGAYRVWSRFEQPTNTENRFLVEIKQGGRVIGRAVMGEKDAPKWFFGGKAPIAQADPSWGSEGLVEQSFDVAGLEKGDAEIVLTAMNQPLPRAPRNIDFLYLTQDMEDSWRTNPGFARAYPLLDAALAAIPTRYYLRLTAPEAQTIGFRYVLNRMPWFIEGAGLDLQANTPSEWIALDRQDVSHWTTMQISTGGVQGKTGSNFRVELASAPNVQSILRTINWSDWQSPELLVSLPPYPNKFPGEKIITVEEQYQNISLYLKRHPSRVGKEPTLPLAQGGAIPAWTRGRVGDAAADVYFGMGMRAFIGAATINKAVLAPLVEVARERFAARGLTPLRSLSVGSYRNPPTPQNIANAKDAVTSTGTLPLLQRFDYGDEIGFSEFFSLVPPDKMAAMWSDWQTEHLGKVEWEKPDSSVSASEPRRYTASMRFYEDALIQTVADMAQKLPGELRPDILYGSNYGAHPFYYPEIAKYIKWFRKTESGNYAANFGRHSEYFWQIGQPGPLINGYIAEHFRAGMKDNPDALLLQYTMPHSPGNTDKSFRRSAFSHLAHGAKGLDYFGIGVNHSFTENYIDFRDKERFAAIRDVNRSMALVEDILPGSHVAPSRIALILSDSTEHWDYAGIMRDKATPAVFSDDYKKTRLAYHLDRIGIYYALIHNSRPPDLLIEEDVQKGELKNYDVAYWVGDCAGASTVAALQNWVQNGGHLVATAGALRNNENKEAVDGGLNLLGLQNARLEAHEWFFRPQIELPRMKPIATIAINGGALPALGILDHVTPANGAKVVATFSDQSPAIIENVLGKGRTSYIAALPGVAYLWGAYQTGTGEPFVPERGPSSHMDLTNFNAPAGHFIALASQRVFTQLDWNGAKIDARLLASPNGYAIPLANYEADVNKPITLTLRGVSPKKITSAVAGVLKARKGKDGALVVTYKPGLTDMIRLDVR